MREVLKCLGTVAYMGGVWAVPEPFTWSWGSLREFNRDFVTGPSDLIFYDRATFSLHSSARNSLVDRMQGGWLLMLDCDMTFEPDVLLKLLTLMEKYRTPVLSGIYRHKALPHHPVLWRWSDTADGFLPLVEFDASVSAFQVDAAGAGCLLVHKTVFAKMAQELPGEQPFEHRGKYGEDMSFFLRCRELNIPVYATPQVALTHLQADGINDNDYVPGWYPSTEDVQVRIPGLQGV